MAVGAEVAAGAAGPVDEEVAGAVHQIAEFTAAYHSRCVVDQKPLYPNCLSSTLGARLLLLPSLIAAPLAILEGHLLVEGVLPRSPTVKLRPAYSVLRMRCTPESLNTGFDSCPTSSA